MTEGVQEIAAAVKQVSSGAQNVAASAGEQNALVEEISSVSKLTAVSKAQCSPPDRI